MLHGSFAAMGHGSQGAPSFAPSLRYRPGIDRETDSEDSDGEGDRIYAGAGGWAAGDALEERRKIDEENRRLAEESGGSGLASAAARSRRVSFWDRVAAVRARTNTFFEEPHSSQGAFLFSILIFLLIIVSSISLCVETLPHYAEQLEAEDYDPLSGPWFVIETVCVVFFTIEFIGRLLSCPSYRQFIISPLNWADFVAILPYYIEIASANGESSSVDLRIVRLIRLARIFRVFKLSRYSAGLQVTGRAMANSADALTLLIFFTVIAMLIFSAAIYYAERGTWNPNLRRWINVRGQVHPFQSIPDSFWWCITTLTTVGYGNEVPITVAGKIIAGLTMMAGILIIALPTSVIGANFMQEWKRHQMRMGQVSKERERMEFRGRHENVREYRARIVREHAVLCETLREISEFVNYSAHIYDVSVPDPAYADGSAAAAGGGPAAANRANSSGGGFGGPGVGGGKGKLGAGTGARDATGDGAPASRGGAGVGGGGGGSYGSHGGGSRPPIPSPSGAAASAAAAAALVGSHGDQTSSRTSGRDDPYRSAIVDDLAHRLSAAEARLREVEGDNERLRDEAAARRGAIPIYGRSQPSTLSQPPHPAGNSATATATSSSASLAVPQSDGRGGLVPSPGRADLGRGGSPSPRRPRSAGGLSAGAVSPNGVVPRHTFRSQGSTAVPHQPEVRLPGAADSDSPAARMQSHHAEESGNDGERGGWRVNSNGRERRQQQQQQQQPGQGSRHLLRPEDDGLNSYKPPAYDATNAYGVRVTSAPHAERGRSGHI